MGFFDETWTRIKDFKTPSVSGREVEIGLGVVNCIFFGVGTIIGGVLSNNLPDVAIGVLQLCLPFVGWIWSIGWGILMISGKNSTILN